MTWIDALVREASSSSDEARLRELRTHRLTAVRTAVAKNPHTPVDVLVVLVADRHHLPRYGVAENPAPDAVQVALQAADSSVRVILAQRTDLDEGTYEVLMSDPDAEVRCSLVWSTHRSDLIERLATDRHYNVRAAVPHRELCPDHVIETLSRDPDNRVRASVASTDRLTDEMILRLVHDRSANVRWHLLTHHVERRDIAEVLASDTDEMNASQARHQLHPDFPGR